MKRINERIALLRHNHAGNKQSDGSLFRKPSISNRSGRGAGRPQVPTVRQRCRPANFNQVIRNLDLKEKMISGGISRIQMGQYLQISQRHRFGRTNRKVPERIPSARREKAALAAKSFRRIGSLR